MLGVRLWCSGYGKVLGLELGFCLRNSMFLHNTLSELKR